MPSAVARSVGRVTLRASAISACCSGVRVMALSLDRIGDHHIWIAQGAQQLWMAGERFPVACRAARVCVVCAGRMLPPFP
jgi:hypothetical protein